jgi:hypothetical protein
MTSERAQIDDPRVRRLADEIIAAQRKEIAEMKYLVDALDDGSQPAEPPTPASITPPVLVSAAEAIHTANVATTDLEEMDSAEVRKALGDGPHCRFHYSRWAGPVLAANLPGAGNATAIAVVKLHGRLTLLDVIADAGEGASLKIQADGITLRIATPRYPRAADDEMPLADATAELRLDGGPEIGYAGFFGCSKGD